MENSGVAKETITAETIDIARYAFGAYQSYAEKPARIEVWVYTDGNSADMASGPTERIG